MTPDVQPPILTRYGYSWLQHPDGLYYGPAYPGADDSLGVLEEEGVLGHSSVAREDYRYFLRDPEPEEDEEPRAERFGWKAGDSTITHPDETQEPV
jgi:hypothetical protein